MGKRCTALFLSVVMMTCFLAGCADKSQDGLDPKRPVTVTMWHNYGGQTQAVIDELVATFNAGVGRERGVMINVTSVSSRSDLDSKLAMVISDEPGAPGMPDITTIYPQMAVLLKEQGLIAPMDELFTQEQLSSYLPQFIEEGRLDDGKLYVFPIAKSTEVLYLNQTLFDRFSAATGVTNEDLASFEGLADAALHYYRWTDSLTPDVPNDGKMFYAADSWMNLALCGANQLGADFAQPGRLIKESDAFARVWNFAAAPTITGAGAIVEEYSSPLLRTGEILCSTGSTAAVLYCVDQITYPDNTSEEVSFSILPYPVFEGAKKVAIQRGGGLCIARSTPAKEQGAALFIGWLSEPEQNMAVVATTGYLPVTKQAFEESLTGRTNHDNATIEKLLATVSAMYAQYEFLIPPSYDGFDAMSRQFETDMDTVLAQAQAAYAATDRSEEARSALILEYLAVLQSK